MLYFVRMTAMLQKFGFLLLSVCVYVANAQEALTRLGELPSAVTETSGLIYFNDVLITHNDSGNEPVLYEIDTLTLTVQRSVRISNVQNMDWEAIAQDEDFIYIGDFGNNLGTRTNLAIHKIAKQAYLSANEVTASTIYFSYEDQTDFSNNGNSDWDAEAFFVLADQLIILTKQWQSQGSVAYTLPKEPGTYQASRIGAIENIGLVTDASYNPSTNTLVILGYSSFLSPFVGIQRDFDSDAIFEGIDPIDLGLSFTQAEGITFTSDVNYYISSEFFSRQTPNITSPSQLFSFTLFSEEVPLSPEPPANPEEPKNPETPAPETDNDTLIIYRNSNDGLYRYEITTDKDILTQIIYDFSGRIVWENMFEAEKRGVLDIPLESALYYFATYLEDKVLAKPFFAY